MVASTQPSRATVDPYRVLFPLGVLFGFLGAAVWPLNALGWIGYPARLHWTLMIQGFEHCFILGFLLTAMPSFLHARHANSVELSLAVAGMLVFGAFSLAGLASVAQTSFAFTIALAMTMAVRRFRREEPPPEEFLFVGLGLSLGLLGGILSAAMAVGLIQEPAPRFGLHLISLGMVLSLVFGVGGLLVPTFSSMREPLAIPGLAKPHERKPRRVLYAILSIMIVAALALEAAGRPVPGAWIRAFAGSVVLLWVWKIFRLPGVRDFVSYSLWTAGWMIFTGLWAAVLLPSRALLAYHVVFIGGFGFLTLGIGTRVVVRHGRHPLAAEGKVLTSGTLAAIGLALIARVAAEFAPRFYLALLGVSATSWILGWLAWGSGAIGYIARIAKPAR